MQGTAPVRSYSWDFVFCAVFAAVWFSLVRARKENNECLLTDAPFEWTKMSHSLHGQEHTEPFFRSFVDAHRPDNALRNVPLLCNIFGDRHSRPQ